MSIPRAVPALGFAAFSGTGKTTLLTCLIPLLGARGVRVGLLKHAHHDFDIDHPGKDSHVLRLAGASPVLVASRLRRAMITERPAPHEPILAEELAFFAGSGADLILVEGFKHAAFPKIELHRPELGHPLLFPNDSDILAIATDAPLSARPVIPVLDLNRPEEIAAFVLDRILTRP